MTDHPETTPAARGVLVAYLVLSPAAFWYHLIEPFEAPKAAVTQLAALAVVVLGVWRGGWQLFRGPVGVAVLLGVASAVVSSVFSVSPATSLRGALDSNMGLGSVLALAVLFAASRAVCREPAAMQQVLHAAVVGLVLACGYAVVQAVGCDPVRWAQAAEYRGWTRPTGTLGHPNYLAGHAAMVLPLLVWACRRRGPVAGALVVLAAGTILVSLSRGALAAGVAALLVCRPSRGWILGGVVAGVLVLLIDSPLSQTLRERVLDGVSSPGRGLIWDGALRLWAGHPWAGTGLDTFGLTWPAVRTAEYWDVEWGFLPVKAHNDLLHALATQGLLGAVAYVLLPISLAWAASRAWRRGHGSCATALAGVAVAYYVQNQVGFATASTAGLLAVVAGMLASLADRDTASEEPPPADPVLVPVTGLAVLGVLVALAQGGAESGRLALVAAALVAAAVAAYHAIPRAAAVDEPAVPWRRLVLPALLAAVPAWRVVGPLLASGCSQQGAHDWAFRLAPSWAVVHERRAWALREAALEASHDAIATACDLEPLAAPLHARRAVILCDLARQGWADGDAVLAAFDLALALDPYDWRTVADAARAATVLGRHAAAERYIESGLTHRPRLAVLLAERGVLELARGQRTAAGRTFREALALDWHGDDQRRDAVHSLLRDAAGDE